MDFFVVNLMFQIIVMCSVRVQADCTLGDDVPESESIKMSGLYIDTSRPASCSGELIEWHYCYYEPKPSRTTTYTVQLGVWRFNPRDNRYTKVGETVFMEKVRRRQDDFECDSIQLQRDAYIQIQRGDYLGVALGTPTLPMAASMGGSTLLHSTAEIQGAAIDGPNFEQLQNSALHISAEIVGEDESSFGTTTATAKEVSTTIGLSPDPGTAVAFGAVDQSPITPPSEGETDIPSADKAQPDLDSGTEFDSTTIVGLQDALESKNTRGIGVGPIAGVAVSGVVILTLVAVLVTITAAVHSKIWRDRGVANTRRSSKDQVAPREGSEGKEFRKREGTFEQGNAMVYEMPMDCMESHDMQMKQGHNKTSGRETWYNNNNFESDGAYYAHETRYASHFEVTPTDNDTSLYETIAGSITNDGDNFYKNGEGIYEDPDSMSIARADKETKRDSELYECPQDAMDYANSTFNIYDDIN